MLLKNNSFLSACLKGAGQVFFMENVLTGALFFLAIGCGTMILLALYAYGLARL